jgi:hypothetical protein
MSASIDIVWYAIRMKCGHCDSIGEGCTITTEFDAGCNLVDQGEAPQDFPKLDKLSTTVRRCPRCGTYYHWSFDFQSIQGGPEHFNYETLRRLTDHDALDLLAKDQARD